MRYKSPQISRTSIVLKAWPVILANASTPLLGLVDTAIIGRTGSTQMLSGLALAALVFNFLFWACGFLRMSTTGFVAQYSGAGNNFKLAQTIVSGLLLSGVLALLLLSLQQPLQWFAFNLLKASTAAEAYGQVYFEVRIWGAPATLGLYVINGLLIGLGLTHRLMLLQLALNGLNMLFSFVFGYVLNGQIAGVALGTVCAEWLVFTAACVALVWHCKAHPADYLKNPKHLLRASLRLKNLAPLLRSNRDIFIRTLFLLLAFAWFTNASAQFGDITLAANHILLQFLSFSAFFLDGFAFVVETYVGKSIGRKNRALFAQAVIKTSQCAFIVALILAALTFLLGDTLAALLTSSVAVRACVDESLIFAALYIGLSFAAFQLDGVFIGATQAAAMRNASILSFVGFIGLYFTLRPLGVAGLWLSFTGYVVFRALCLSLYWRRVVNALT